MSIRPRTAWLALGGVAAMVGIGAAAVRAQAAAEDDLTVVKRAVAQEPSAPPPAARSGERDQDRPARVVEPRRSGKEPTWLKVRVTPRNGRKGKVTVNVPLALVRAMGDGWPVIRFGCGGRDRDRGCSLDLAEMVAALEAGQDLVEIEGEDELVRVWVE